MSMNQTSDQTRLDMYANSIQQLKVKVEKLETQNQVFKSQVEDLEGTVKALQKKLKIVDLRSATNERDLRVRGV